MAKEARKSKNGALRVRKQERKSRESSASSGYDDNGFNYEEFCKREFGKSPHHRTGLKWYWWCLGVMVIAGMAAAALWLR